MIDLKFKHINELRDSMTEEQIKRSEESFKKYYPEGTEDIQCTDKTDSDGEEYLKYVDPDDFT